MANDDDSDEVKKLIARFRAQLEVQPEEYFEEVFNMSKRHVVDPDAVWNFGDLRSIAGDALDPRTTRRLLQVHAEIWARTVLLITATQRLIQHVRVEGGVPSEDRRVKDHLAALNLISLQYGVCLSLDESACVVPIVMHYVGVDLIPVLCGVLPQHASRFSYDVALSFAGEDRTYVKQVARELQERGRQVFYDEFRRSELWGKDLSQHLSDVYMRRARICVVFISRHYAIKAFPTLELRSALARTLEEKREYLLPVRFDETQVPGLLPTVKWIDGNVTTPSELARLIASKLEAI